MKSGNLTFLEPSGPIQACNGTALTLKWPFMGFCLEIMLQCSYLGYYMFSWKKNDSNLIVILSHCFSHTFRTIHVLVTFWKELFPSLLTEVLVLCYEPHCHTCLHFTISSKFMTTDIFLQCSKTNDNHSTRESLDKITISLGSTVTKF